jgi:hypothetical protein
MEAVLLQDEPVLLRREDNGSIQVDITVIAEGKTATFLPVETSVYVVEKESIRLIGSGGSPREFLLAFTLSAESQKSGYRFANPAIKFFQRGSNRQAGFRVNLSPASQVSVTVSLFNTLSKGETGVEDDFSVLLLEPTGHPFSHDPTIIWDPPNG